MVEMLTADTGTVAAAAAAAAAVATGGEPPRSADTVLGAVIDGQHRLGAAHLLQQRGKLTPTLQAHPNPTPPLTIPLPLPLTLTLNPPPPPTPTPNPNPRSAPTSRS